MTNDFNIRDNDWNLSYLHHSIYTDTLIELAGSFGLGLSIPVNQIPNQYADNPNNSNSVIDLIFLRADSEEFNNHSIIPNLRNPLYHTLLTISIIINKEFIQDK